MQHCSSGINCVALAVMLEIVVVAILPIIVVIAVILVGEALLVD